MRGSSMLLLVGLLAEQVGCVVYGQPVVMSQTKPLPPDALRTAGVSAMYCREQVVALGGYNGVLVDLAKKNNGDAYIDLVVDRRWTLPFPSYNGCLIVSGVVVDTTP